MGKDRARIAAANAPVPPPPPPIEELGDKSPEAKRTRDFLFPKMPDAFRPSNVRKMTIDQLRARYITVLSATMGNHSMSLFYCCWTQEQFDVAYESVKFQRAIARAKSQLADRATFIMHRGLGLIEGTLDQGGPNTQVTAALAKVIESLRAKEVEKEGGGGFEVVVKGLDRSAPPPAAPDRPK